ncbi:hypothetical protein Mgra_00000552 [Meloidogyne graminicola]|uniref:SPRY domain-containing protein n=1 Tax=Meloidogyne graminicola TaxID=189291 RepID=A0A8T0A472_9BILA|nr:hypothetical protein Mgra_00000552 [Meloidogyne graminicola]
MGSINSVCSETNQDLHKKVELNDEVKQLKEEKTVSFIYVSNKWKFIYDEWNCCENKCINTNKPNAFCINGNGFIQIKNDIIIKYINCKDENENKFIKSNENLEFKHCSSNCISFSLFYYEVTFQFEKNEWMAIGLQNKNFFISLWPKQESIYFLFENNVLGINLPSFSFKNGDNIGCGVVYPPPEMIKKLPYIFFTFNGKQIGNN